MTATAVMPPIHPGEVLLTEFLEPLGVTQHRLAVAVGVPPRRINEIVHGKRGISADTALRLSRFFGTTDRFWLNLQSRYDLEVERDRLADALDRIEPLATA
ncbi:MAG TPA: HigA family addiction module antitoxin [Mycobacteriales bacterium]|jgi:addiction module HigA family antidote|nr:HigA family addiction module antitoxin [Mycobacteriales bacterium]